MQFAFRPNYYIPAHAATNTPTTHDDVVEIRRKGENLVGTGPELTRYHMELRGLGIINVKDLFGVAAVRKLEHLGATKLGGPLQGSCRVAFHQERRHSIL